MTDGRRIAIAFAAGALAGAIAVSSVAVVDARGHVRKPHPSPRPTPIATIAPTPLPTATPTPAPTFAPTATPTARPTPTAGPTPAPTVTQAASSTSCPSSLQAAIDATPAAGLLVLGPCTFHEAVIVSRAITITGPATITGDGIRTSWMAVRASDVHVDGLRFLNAAAGGYQCGSLDVSAARFTLTNATLAHGCYADVRLWTGSKSATLTGNDVSDGPVVGVLGWETNGSTIAGGRLHDNRGSTNVGNEAGGIKLGQSTGVTVRDLEADHNVGPGIWLDVYDDDSVVSSVEVHDNTRSGIHIEIGSRVHVTGSLAYRNGTDAGLNAFEAGCGIFLSSVQDTTATGNTAAWNGPASPAQPAPVDICSVSQNRQPWPHTGNQITGNILRLAPQAWMDYPSLGVDPSVLLAPNTLVADTDPRIAGLR